MKFAESGVNLVLSKLNAILDLFQLIELNNKKNGEGQNRDRCELKRGLLINFVSVWLGLRSPNYCPIGEVIVVSRWLSTRLLGDT